MEIIELHRAFFRMFTYVLCTTISALIIWDEDWRQSFKQLIVYSILASLTHAISYQINNEAIRFPLEIMSGFLWMWIIYRKPFAWVAKIFTTSYVIGIPLVMISTALTVAVLGPASESAVYHHYGIIIASIVFVLGILGTAQARRFLIKKRLILIPDNIQGWAVVATALLFQLSVSMGLIWAQSEIKNDDSWFVLAIAGTIIIYIVCLLIMGAYVKSLRKQVVITTQDAVSQNILELLDTLKAQQHDFFNHLQVISGLTRMHNLEELQEYLNTLIEDVRNQDKAMEIRNPILAALINAKLSQAEMRGITLKLDIKSHFQGIEDAAVDLSRILGNLINNAMDAVENIDIKEVELKITKIENKLVCSVWNAWVGPFPAKSKLFSPGFSTKKGEHRGLGLYICLQLANRLHGELDCRFTPEEGVEFILSIPRQVGGEGIGKAALSDQSLA